MSRKAIPKGVTRPVRLTLTDGTRTQDAAFSVVDQRVAIQKFKDGRTEFDFVDSYKSRWRRSGWPNSWVSPTWCR